MAHPSLSLAEHIPPMYAVPPRDLLYEQSESALLEHGKVFVLGSDTSVRFQPSEESEETLSPNQDGTFSYGAPSEPLGCDIEPLMWAQSTKFFQNLDQLDILAAVAGTARQADPGLGARPHTSEIPVNISSPPAAGPSQHAPTHF